MTGVAWFNEVFFDDVRVPRATWWSARSTAAGTSRSPRCRTSAATVVPYAAPAARARRPRWPGAAPQRRRVRGARSARAPAPRAARDRRRGAARCRTYRNVTRDHAHRPAGAGRLDPEAVLERARAAPDGAARSSSPARTRALDERRAAGDRRRDAGSTSCCGRAPRRSTPARPRCSATSSPSACWACRAAEPRGEEAEQRWLHSTASSTCGRSSSRPTPPGANPAGENVFRNYGMLDMYHNGTDVGADARGHGPPRRARSRCMSGDNESVAQGGRTAPRPHHRRSTTPTRPTS